MSLNLKTLGEGIFSSLERNLGYNFEFTGHKKIKWVTFPEFGIYCFSHELSSWKMFTIFLGNPSSLVKANTGVSK